MRGDSRFAANVHSKCSAGEHPIPLLVLESAESALLDATGRVTVDCGSNALGRQQLVLARAGVPARQIVDPSKIRRVEDR